MKGNRFITTKMFVHEEYAKKKFVRPGAFCVGLLLLVFSSVGYAADRVVSDEDITNHIDAELLFDQAVMGNAINVQTENGIVILSGSVTNLLAKDRAQRIAEDTVGVRSVVNRIEVNPFEIRSDRDVKKAVEDALLRDPAADSYDVKTSVDNGVVTLTGKVDSWQEGQLCMNVAKSIKGVRGVKNEITIDYETDRTDYEIQQEVKAVLANDVRVDDALISVKVKDQKVTLSGTVGSLQEKRLAENDAWVAGVQSVNTDELNIKWWARDTMRRKDLYESRSDEEIQKALEDTYFYDPRVISFNPKITVHYGVVTLSGIVDNALAKKAAAQDAHNTLGVVRVINNLKVRPQTIPSNDKLERRVHTALSENPYIDQFDLTVSAYGGIIYLSGTVNTSWERNLATRVAEGINGVVYVVNNINYEHQWVWKPDREIEQEVKDQLYWSPFVDQDNIQVAVDNGVVTLTGTVGTWSERQTAEDDAYEGGAKDVINELNVTYKQVGPYYSYYGGIYGPYSYSYPIP